ncbi:MAG: hypothetical protein BWY87_01293 [Deltaproteobacteria bacterium ADurb.Bin510]|nr:MAG: hypothetical protein BWY87_01293 [Deltaproteobacteria bacterium ADurb.Bin510]
MLDHGMKLIELGHLIDAQPAEDRTAELDAGQAIKRQHIDFLNETITTPFTAHSPKSSKRGGNRPKGQRLVMRRQRPKP